MKLIPTAGEIHTQTSASALPSRIERVLHLVREPGDAVLLLGEPGSGKTRLAEETAVALEQSNEHGVHTVVLPSPHQAEGESEELFRLRWVEAFGVSASEAQAIVLHTSDEEIVARLRIHAGDPVEGHECVIVAHGIDAYPAWVSRVLAALVRTRTMRLIATARRLFGAAEEVSRDPRVHRLSLGPLNLDEAGEMLTAMLRCEQIEFTTLHRWHAITNGYAHALTVLVLSLERRGLLSREKGVVWEKTQHTATVPEEFIAYLEETCTSAELETLEFIALLEPLTETVLIEELEPEHLRALQHHGLIVQHVITGGRAALSTSHQLLANALTERMPSGRRTEVSERCFDILRHSDATDDAERRIRLVILGLDAERALPIEWLLSALTAPKFDRDPATKLRIARAITQHPDAFGTRLVDAGISMCRNARLLGDERAILEGIELILLVLSLPEVLRNSTITQRIRATLELVTHYTLDLEQHERAFDLLGALADEGFERGSTAAEMVRCAYAMMFARIGKLRTAGQYAPAPSDEGRMQVEWVRSEARLVSSLILTQQGQFQRAIDVAERARAFAVLGNRAERFVADELTLAIFLAQWAAGSVLAARDSLVRVQRQAFSRLHDTRFVDAGFAALALTEGRWIEAAQGASRALERLDRSDPYGISALLHAIYAYANATLGEHDEARRAIHLAETQRSGTSRVLSGLVRMLTVEARLWSEETDAGEHALRTIAWANAEGFALVELRAMLVLAGYEGRLDAAHLARARQLATSIDGVMGSTLLTFLEETNGDASRWDTPSARRLTDLGVWVPLPRTATLSPREREIAMHAALGYSSRWIADHFFLSTRTVETHLRHVFTKLGVTGRDELRVMLREGKLSA